MSIQDIRVLKMTACTDLMSRRVLHEHQISDYKDVQCVLAMLLSIPMEYSDVHSGQTMTVNNAKLSSSKKTLREFVLRQGTPGNTNHPCLSRSVASKLPALRPSMKYLATSQRIAAIAIVSVVFACGSAILVTTAVAQAFVQSRHISDIHQRKFRKQVELDETLMAASDLSTSPQLAADSLLLADELRARARLSSENVLNEVAVATTAVSGVRLDRLIWIQAETNEMFESLDHAMSALAQSRRGYNLDRATGIQLQLAGYLETQDLSEQKRTLDSFVEHLHRMRAVSGVQVLISPLDAALSSETDMYGENFFSLLATLDGDT